MRSRIGLIALKDKDGDHHTIPVTYISRITDWKREWGPDISAFVLGDHTEGTFPKYILVDMPREEAEQVFIKAANGHFVDLSGRSGVHASQKAEQFGALSQEQRDRILYGSQLSKMVAESAEKEAEEEAEKDAEEERAQPPKTMHGSIKFEPIL
jgi:hypothetical protein